MDLSIIIVNYKTEKLLKQCIESIIRSTLKLTYEIIVVDNDSLDNSESIVKTIDPSIQWYNIGYNSGFSRANNFGIRKAKGEYVLLLNSDTEIIDNAIEKSLEFYKKVEQNTKIGLLTCKLLWGKDDDPGYPQLAAHYYFPSIPQLLKLNVMVNYFTDRKGFKNKKINQINGQVVWVAAAFALCNRKIFIDDNLYLDEDFFMYSEDVEWNYRISKKGYIHYYFADAEIFHYGGASSTPNFHKRAQIIVSDFLFIRKSYSFFYFVMYATIFQINNILEIAYEQYLKIRKKPSVYDKEYSKFKLQIAKNWTFRIVFFNKTLKKLNYMKYDKFA